MRKIIISLLLVGTVVLSYCLFFKKGMHLGSDSQRVVSKAHHLRPEITLHAIGVLRGEYPRGTDTRPWWAKCKDDGYRGYRSEWECQSKTVNEEFGSSLTVDVSDTSGPIALLLMGVKPIEWKLNVKSEVKLERIILSGRGPQTLTGRPVGVPLEVYTTEPSVCSECWQDAKSFYVYSASEKDAVSFWHSLEEIKEILGKYPNTLQLREEAVSFSILAGMPSFDVESAFRRKEKEECSRIKYSLSAHRRSIEYLKDDPESGVRKEIKRTTESVKKKEQEYKKLNCSRFD